jgi:hypothetical protein
MMDLDSVGRKTRRAGDVIALCAIRAGFEPLRTRGIAAAAPFRPLALRLLVPFSDEQELVPTKNKKAADAALLQKD